MTKNLKLLAASALAISVSVFASQHAKTLFAVDDTTPNYIIYEGRLLDSASAPLTSTHILRFSLWNSIDFVSADKNPDGSLNTTSSTYAAWTETQSVTPNSEGVFSVKLGSITPLPEVKFNNHKFLQIEVKRSGDPDTSYQIMDVTGDNGVDNTDRQSIGSTPYAKNTERIDDKEIGLSEDDLALLGPNGQWDPSQIPGGTDEDSFVLDHDDTVTTGNILLQFGKTLNKYLAYDLDNTYFYFNDDLYINGNLIITGTINGKDPADIHTQNTDTGTTAADFVVNMGGNKLIISSTGLTADRTITFPDGDTTVVGTDNTQTLTNKTIDGDLNNITNINWSSIKERDGRLVLVPQYPGSTIQADGSNNQVTVRLGTDETNNHQYYVLTSNKTDTLHDLDIYLRIPVPSDFVSWKTDPVQIFLKTSSTSASDNQLNVSIKDTTNLPVSLTGASALAGSSADTWEQKNINFTGAPTWTPGEYLTLKLSLSSMSNNGVYIGEIYLNYNGK